jgi:predicted GIY-YIG superfamily endonuclease
MIYILEFDRKISGRAGYYIGWTTNLDARLRHHANGTGAALCRAALRQGIGWRVVVTFCGSRDDERRLKNYKNTPRLIKRFQAGTLRLEMFR